MGTSMAVERGRRVASCERVAEIQRLRKTSRPSRGVVANAAQVRNAKPRTRERRSLVPLFRDGQGYVNSARSGQSPLTQNSKCARRIGAFENPAHQYAETAQPRTLARRGRFPFWDCSGLCQAARSGQGPLAQNSKCARRSGVFEIPRINTQKHHGPRTLARRGRFPFWDCLGLCQAARSGQSTQRQNPAFAHTLGLSGIGLAARPIEVFPRSALDRGLDRPQRCRPLGRERQLSALRDLAQRRPHDRIGYLASAPRLRPRYARRGRMLFQCAGEHTDKDRERVMPCGVFSARLGDLPDIRLVPLQRRARAHIPISAAIARRPRAGASAMILPPASTPCTSGRRCGRSVASRK